MKLVTGLNCTANLEYAYNQFCNVFEKFAKERFCKKTLNDENCGKEKNRLRHYIQSFKPDEVSSEEAHKVGVEWGRKVFGENHQVLVTTHVDKNHIHNHFAVSAYDLDGKKVGHILPLYHTALFYKSPQAPFLFQTILKPLRPH